MTCGSGTKNIPKDYKFENFLRNNLPSEKFDRIVYYDTCIITKPAKLYGKIIISDDCIYTYVDNKKKFSKLFDYQYLQNVEMISDIPNFIFGPMRNNCIHIKLSFYVPNHNNGKTIKEKFHANQQFCCRKPTDKLESDSLQLLNVSESDQNAYNKPENETSRRFSLTSEQMSTDFVDIYILNKYSSFLCLFKKTYIDYQIRETVHSSSDTSLMNCTLSQSKLSQLFDKLIFDVVNNMQNLDVNRTFLMELINSGNKYIQIKVLFWTKSPLFDLLVEQFFKRLENITSMDSSDMLKATPLLKEKMHLNLEYLNLILKVFTVFLCETDHFYSKWTKLRKNAAKIPLSMILSILKLIFYLNFHDRCDVPDQEATDLDLEIDFTKYDITVNSIQIIYYLIRSSETSFNDSDNEDPYTICTISNIIESQASYSNSEAVFNCFINQTFRMIFIWLFPELFNYECQRKLKSEQIKTIFQLLSSLRSIFYCAPKLMEILRREIKEEFKYMLYHEIDMPDDYPLSGPTLKLLNSFKKNIIHSNEIFVD